jgi:hypothetical protein
MKKTKVLISVILSIVILLIAVFGGWRIYTYILIDNVYDEIYYAFRASSNNTETKKPWNNGGGLRYTDVTLIINDVEVGYPFNQIEYSDRVMDDGERLVYGIDSLEEILYIRYTPEHHASSEDHLTIVYEYDPHTNIFTYSPLTVFEGGSRSTSDGEKVASTLLSQGYNLEDVIAIQHHALFDVLLHDYFKWNSRESRFTVEKMGEVTYVDDTFVNLPADWQTNPVEGVIGDEKKGEDGISFSFDPPIGWTSATDEELSAFNQDPDDFYLVGLQRYPGLSIDTQQVRSLATGADGSMCMVSELTYTPTDVQCKDLLEFLTEETKMNDDSYDVSEVIVVTLGESEIDAIKIVAPAGGVTMIGMNMTENRVNLILIDAVDSDAFEQIIAGFS